MSSGYRDKAVTGVFWTSVEKFGSQILSLVLGIVIARILMPADYGVIGMTAIFIAVATTLIDSGFGSALIQNTNRNEDDYSTCFYFNICIGVFLYIVLYIGSPWIADFYNTPILKSVLKVLGLVLVFNSLTISQTAKLTIKFHFRDLCIVTLGSQLITGIMGLVMAYRGYGVWALVYQQLGASILRVILIEVFTRWVPKLRFTKIAFHRLFSYGSKITCSSIINTIYANSYTLVIGRVYTSNDVGYYTRGLQFAQLPSNSLLNVIMKVAFPLMSEVQDDTEKLRFAYQKFLRTTVFILYPVLFGLAALAHPLIQALLGDKWLPCVPYLQILCVGGLFDPLTHINLNILYVKGRTDLVLKLELIKKPIAFLLLFASIPFGIIWVCASSSIYGLIAYSFNCFYTGKYIDLGFWKQMLFCLPIMLSSGVMGIACYAVSLAFSNAWISLTVGMLTGIALYIAIAYISRDESFNDLKEIICQRRRS